MVAVQSNFEVLLVALPMVGILFAGFFRLDEMIGTPKKKKTPGHTLAGRTDEDGFPICMDPDGTIPGRIRPKS